LDAVQAIAAIKAAVSPDGVKHDMAGLSPAQGIGLDNPGTAPALFINVVKLYA